MAFGALFLEKWRRKRGIGFRQSVLTRQLNTKKRAVGFSLVARTPDNSAVFTLVLHNLQKRLYF